MIIGDYPCCGESLMIAVPKTTPVFLQEECPHCGASVWHRLSRLDPKSWTEADFLAKFIVDEETKSIRPREEPEPPPAIQVILDGMAKAAAEWVVAAMVFDSSTVRLNPDGSFDAIDPLDIFIPPEVRKQ